jgi:PIN domain nuclease of toxin-antitoxin system
MRLLVDGHALLWCIEDTGRLSRRAARVLADGRNRQFVSVATIWELAVKASLGRLRLSRPFDVVMDDAIRIHRFEVMNVELRHALRVAELPRLHGDPFDRMLVAQAIEERCVLVSGDPAVREYPVEHLW